MKKIFLFAILTLFSVQCTSIKSHNKHINDLISVNKLKSDIDFAYKKLQKLHPRLNWYISKKDLDFKFDSLKNTISKPMTSLDFYKKLSPVISTIRQGHMLVSPAIQLFTAKESKAITKKGVGPLSQFDFEFFNDKLYIVKNKSYDKSIKIGTEVVSLNDKNPVELINEYNKYYTSDGFNKTLKNNLAGRIFSRFYIYENGYQDGLKYNFKFNDSLKTVFIKRKVVDSTGNNKKTVTKKLTAYEIATNKAIAVGLKIDKSVYGYDETTKKYNREFKFNEKDSSIATIKINGFMKGDYRRFYEESFSKIAYKKTKTLIIDIRNNGGGRLGEIVELYSYLADSTFVFLDKSEVASKTSMFNIDYFKGGSIVSKILKPIGAPIVYSYLFLKVHKNENGKYYYSIQNKPKKLSSNAFKGKVYVIINGGSFSASSIISTNLKGSKRATFVGEETGGAYNGTVAGMMPIIELPNSKNKIRIGLMSIITHYKTRTEGRGIIPDKEIIPTLEDRIKENDPEMNWILEDIKSKTMQDTEFQK